MANNTGNSVPSANILDFQDNAENLDTSVNSTSETWVDRLGVTRATLNGQIEKARYQVPVDYESGIAFTVADKSKTVDENGIIYAPLPSSLPFTTSGTWVGGDEDKFYVVQGLVSQDLDDLVRVFSDLSDLQSYPNIANGSLVFVTSLNAKLEVRSPTGDGILLVNGLEAFGIKQDLTFDNISEMKSQPPGLFAEGSRVHLKDYYSGWSLDATRTPYPFSGSVVADNSVLAIRGNAADGYGDHALGNGLSFLVDTDGVYVNRKWGCRPNTDVDDNANLQAMFDSPKNGTDAAFVFSGGVQYIKPSSQLSVNNLRKVEFNSESGSLKFSGTDSTKYGLYVDSCSFVKWNGVDFDLNNQIFSGAVRIIDIRYQVKIRDTNMYNFANTDDVGFECALQAGFVISDVNKKPGNLANSSSPGMQMVNCSFGNEAPEIDIYFNYNDNFCGGTGVKLLNDCEYWRITNCGFFGNCVGLWVEDAANGTVVGCEFQETLGVLKKSDIATNTPSGGAIFNSFDVGGANGGKLTIADCKFNHNWGFSIRSPYVSPNRPISVSGCQFIANSFIPINFASTKQCTVHNNHFERAHNHLSLPTYPWGPVIAGIEPCFIWLAPGADYTKITENHADFLPDGMLVYFDASGEGFKQKIANNTVTSTVDNSVNSFYNATPDIAHDNYILG